MLTMKLSLPFALAITIFAETNGGDQFMGPWSQLTALGIVAVVLVFIVTKMLPNIHDQFVSQAKTFADAMAKVQESFAEATKEIAQRQHEDSAELTRTVTALREHCATARASLKDNRHE